MIAACARRSPDLARQPAKDLPDGWAELRGETLEGLLVRALSRGRDEPHESVDGRTVDPAAPKLGNELAEHGFGEDRNRN